MNTTVITIDNLACAYQEQVLFEKLNFKVLGGKCVLIQGANGSGKTTLLKSLAGYHEGYTGSIRFAPIMTPATPYPCCFLGHQDGLKENLSVAENIQLFMLLSENHTLSQEALLSQFNLLPIKDQLIKHCSKGQKKRTALVQLCINQAPIWLLDEPFVSLDDQGRRLIEGLIINHLAQQGIVIMSSHQSISLAEIKPIRIHL